MRTTSLVGTAVLVAATLVLTPSHASAQQVGVNAGTNLAGLQLLDPEDVEIAPRASLPAEALWSDKGVLAPQGASGKTMTRGSRRIAIGAAIGGGAGLVVGEYLFGQYLDLPHGPDMLLGAGIGAGVGALIAWLTGDRAATSNPKSSVSVSPVVSPSRKALLVTLTLKSR